MDRREFLKIAGISGIGMSIPGSIDNLFNSAEASPRSHIVVATGKSPSEITRAAIEAFGGIKKFISKGDVVAIKPNMAWDRRPEHAANTNPYVVGTVVRLCIEAGAKQVKVFDRPVNDPRRCYFQSGIEAAAEAAGADVIHIDERKFRDMKINGRALKTWPIYSEILDADKIINVPVAKHHGLAKLTMSMKNWMGVMGGRRSQIHQDIDQSLVDLSMAMKPALTVLDAVRILTANGPQGGSLSDVKQMDTVIVGTDQVAIDSFGATLFGMKGSDLGYVRIANRDGHGVMDLDKIDIKKITV